ncbi:MAG: NUDIX hydrolase [bacterium]
MKKLDRLSTEIVDKNPYWEYRKDIYILPNQKEGTYFYVHSAGSVIIIAKINDKFIFVKQFRYLNQRYSIELPGGGINPDYSIIENALKEFSEETGYTSKQNHIIGEFNPFIGVTNEMCYVIEADELELVSAIGDESEEIEVIYLTAEEVDSYIKNNSIWNGQTIAAWTIYKNKYME